MPKGTATIMKTRSNTNVSRRERKNVRPSRTSVWRDQSWLPKAYVLLGKNEKTTAASQLTAVENATHAVWLGSMPSACRSGWASSQ